MYFVNSKMTLLKYITATTLLIGSLFGQSFGKNKVQYRDFDWKFISSPNFDVYYYGDEIELANFTMEASIEAYELFIDSVLCKKDLLEANYDDDKNLLEGDQVQYNLLLKGVNMQII